MRENYKKDAKNAMVHSSTSVGSDHKPTAAVLRDRGLKHVIINKRIHPPELTTICDDFKDVVTRACRGSPRCRPVRACCLSENGLFAKGDLSKLQIALTDDYLTETAFDEALFEALRDCLVGYQFTNGEPNAIILKCRRPEDNYAVGFSRQVRHAYHLLPKVKVGEAAPSQSLTASTSGLDPSIADHSVCLFEKTTGKIIGMSRKVLVS
jgi:hypothetical protein